MQRRGNVVPARVEEPPAEAGLGREGDRVQDAVEPAPPLAEVITEGGEVAGVGDVELEHLGLARQALDGASGDAHRPPERRQRNLGALLLRQPRDRECDRRLGEDAGYEDALAREQHESAGGTEDERHVVAAEPE